MNEINKVFESLDEIVSTSLDRDDAEGFLACAYGMFCENLKGRLGTSRYFSGVSEYLFFTYIMRYIERHMGIKFRPEGEGDTRLFRSNNIVMTHDISTSRFIGGEGFQTDIAVFVKSSDGHRLVAAFEMKVTSPNYEALKGDVEKLKELGNRTSSLLFEILIHKPTKQAQTMLREFCEMHRGRAFVISKCDLGCNIGLNKAIDRVIEEVRH